MVVSTPDMQLNLAAELACLPPTVHARQTCLGMCKQLACLSPETRPVGPLSLFCNNTQAHGSYGAAVLQGCHSSDVALGDKDPSSPGPSSSTAWQMQQHSGEAKIGSWHTSYCLHNHGVLVACLSCKLAVHPSPPCPPLTIDVNFGNSACHSAFGEAGRGRELGW